MTKYLINRILRGILSVIAVVAIVMLLIYTLMNRDQIFAMDPVYTRMNSNSKEAYKMQQWEKYGYLDYISYSEYLKEILTKEEIDQATYDVAVKFGDEPEDDTPLAKQYVEKFTEHYEKMGYNITRLNADKFKGKYKDGGRPVIFAHKDTPILSRVWDYFTGIFDVDNIHYVQDDIEDRGLSFTLYDPVYGGDKFSPAIMGNGTRHKYLLYFDSSFPYIHQNLFSIRLGESYTIKQGIDVFNIMADAQGSPVKSTVTYPTGLVAESADDLHSATYVSGSLEGGLETIKNRYTDNYTNVPIKLSGLSKTGYSFVIGIISVILTYILAIPLGTVMALKKDKLIDKIGTVYIVFIMAVPSLAYIFLFKSIGYAMGLPTTFIADDLFFTRTMYILPIISLALPSVANLMKWLRRYMIDQMNSDYVKFARSGGLSEGEIFTKHILKNAIIPIVHGIPGSLLGAMTGAIITERIYVVPGAGGLLTEAIGVYDNGVIVGLALFYALLSVVSIILGDILMSLMDPRISFVAKER